MYDPDAPKPKQIGRHHLADMTPEQIVAAHDAGQFDDLLAGATTTEKE